MTELTTYQAPAELAPQAAGVALATTTTQATQTTVDLVAWANELGAAHQIATAICGTSFVPSTFKGKPDETATAILYGKSVGLDPLAALSNVFVVHGKPAMYSRTMQALAQRAGVEFERTEATEQQVTVQDRRRGGNWQAFTWSIQRAEKAGYTSNAKYRTDPIGMLTAKAYAEAVRLLAPDVLMGISVAEEVELGDHDPAPAAIDQAPAPRSAGRVVRRKQVAGAEASAASSPAPEAVVVETGEIIDETPAAPEPVKTITKPTQGKVSTLLDSLGYTDRVHKLEYVKQVFANPDLTTVAALSVEQGKELVAHLEGQAQLPEAERWAPNL